MADELSTSEMIASVTTPAGATESKTSATDGAASHGSTDKTTQTQTPTWDPKALKYLVEGREIIEPWEMVQKRAQLGYHYAQRAEGLTKREQDADQKFKEVQTILEENKKLQRWRQYDEHAQKDPAWGKHVEESWNNRDNLRQNPDQDNPLGKVVTELQQKLSAIEQRDQERQRIAEEQKVQARNVEEDKSFDSEISEVKKSYKEVDFAATDEQGKSLEYRVMERMKALGFSANKPGQFLAAFKDLHFDNLMAKKLEAAKEEHAKEVQKQRKNGLLGTKSQAPTGPVSNGSLRNTSYDDIGQIVKRELGLI